MYCSPTLFAAAGAESSWKRARCRVYYGGGRSSRQYITGCSAVGIAPALGVPWRYPGRDREKRRKALWRLRLRDFPRLLKAAQKRVWPHKWPQTEKSLIFPLAVVSWQKSEYPGVAQLVGRDIWDVEVGCSSHLTRTKIPLKSLISEGFSYSLSIAAQAVKSLITAFDSPGN